MTARLKDRARAVLTAAALAAAFAALYLFTAQRGVAWGDSGLFQMRALTGDVRGLYGIALAHPLYVRLLSLAVAHAPVGAACWTANACAGLCMALAVAGFYFCARLFTGRPRAALVAAVTLGFSHMAWWLSTMAEVYTLSLALLAAETYCALRLARGGRPAWFLPLALLNGLHFAVHNFALLALPVYAALFLAAAGRRGRAAVPRLAGTAAAACALWTAGAWPVLALGAADYAAHGRLALAVQSVLVGDCGPQVSGVQGVPPFLTAFNYALAAMNLCLPAWLFLLVRTVRKAFGKDTPGRADRDGRMTALAAALFAVHFLFWVRYRVADQATFILPTLFFATLLLAPLLAGVRRTALWCAATAVCAVAVPRAAAAFLTACAPPQKARVPLPFRDDWAYFAEPWKHNETSAQRFADAAARELPPGAFVYTYDTEGMPLACARRLGRLRADVRFSMRWTEGDGPAAAASAPSRWELRPFGAYRLSPPDARLVKRGLFHEVILSDNPETNNKETR